MSYYIYFILPEPESRFVTFGRSESLGSRWIGYSTSQPDPELVGLIKCESKEKMNMLELEIKNKFLKDYIFRNEWLYHSDEVKTYYKNKTNVDIKKTLLESIKTYNDKRNERMKEYRNRPEVKEKRRKYQKEYRQRPERKKGNREWMREYRKRNKQ